jgi:hypothetical protein
LAPIWPLSSIAAASSSTDPDPGDQAVESLERAAAEDPRTVARLAMITRWLLIASGTGSRPKVPTSVILPAL